MQGYTSVSFEGGCLDGTRIDQFPSRHSGEQVRARRGVVAVRMTEGVGILKLKESSPLPENWLSYNVDVYESQGLRPGKGHIYAFSETIAINRCESLTQKNKQCKNDAEHLSDYCNTHRSKAKK